MYNVFIDMFSKESVSFGLMPMIMPGALLVGSNLNLSV